MSLIPVCTDDGRIIEVHLHDEPNVATVRVPVGGDPEMFLSCTVVADKDVEWTEADAELLCGLAADSVFGIKDVRVRKTPLEEFGEKIGVLNRYVRSMFSVSGK